MGRSKYEQCFIKKVNSLHGDSNYHILKELAEIALKNYREGSKLQQRYNARTFMDKIIVMPADYISAWLRKENDLSYREEDKRLLAAFQNNCMELQLQHMDMDICRIPKQKALIYIKNGYHVLKQEGDDLLLGKSLKSALDNKKENGVSN